MLYLFLWVTAVFFLLIKGSLVGHILLRYFDIDLIIIIMIYVFVFLGEKRTGIFAFGMGILMDLFSGVMFGFYTFIYLFIFLAILFGSRPLDLTSTGTQIITVFLAVLLKGILMITLLKLFSLRAVLLLPDYFLIVFSILFSGIIAPFLFYSFSWFNRFVIESKSEM